MNFNLYEFKDQKFKKVLKIFRIIENLEFQLFSTQNNFTIIFKPHETN